MHAKKPEGATKKQNCKLSMKYHEGIYLHKHISKHVQLYIITQNYDYYFVFYHNPDRQCPSPFKLFGDKRGEIRVLHETQQPLKRLTGFVETYHYSTSPCQDAPDVRQQQALQIEVDAG